MSVALEALALLLVSVMIVGILMCILMCIITAAKLVYEWLRSDD